MNVTKQHHFIKKPQIGNIVKVYLNKNENCYGSVCSMFTRHEHRNSYVCDEKLVPEYDCTTDCVMLIPVDDVPFNNINYFLPVERVDFQIL
jgi:hypothetical protein